MDLEFAGRINNEMVKITFMSNDLDIGKPDIKWLRQQELSDMIAARPAILAARGDLAGGGEFGMTCDDRLVAAIYCGLHYDPCQQSEVTPVATVGTAAVCIIGTSGD